MGSRETGTTFHTTSGKRFVGFWGDRIMPIGLEAKLAQVSHVMVLLGQRPAPAARVATALRASASVFDELITSMGTIATRPEVAHAAELRRLEVVTRAGAQVLDGMLGVRAPLPDALDLLRHTVGNAAYTATGLLPWVRLR